MCIRDRDKIFNHEDVQLSKDEFRKTYVFVPEFATADEAKQHAVYAWDGKDNNCLLYTSSNSGTRR